MKSKRFVSRELLTRFQEMCSHLPESKRSHFNNQPFNDSLRGYLEIAGSGREIQAGEILFRQGDEAHNMYWIETGAVVAVQGDLDTEHVHVLTFRFPGQVVGEIALIENIHRTASIVAVYQSRLIAISQERFQAVLSLIPGIGVELLRVLSARLVEIEPADYGAGLYDHLTGALSRRALDHHLKEEINLAYTYGYGFSLVFIDLDNFKQINDEFGHLFGDKVLVAFVSHIKADLRTTDLLFRYGGDEFILILQGIDHGRGPRLMERLLESTRTQIMVDGCPVEVSFSAGISYYSEDGDDPADLLVLADRRAYLAKNNGRGRVVGLLD